MLAFVAQLVERGIGDTYNGSLEARRHPLWYLAGRCLHLRFWLHDEPMHVAHRCDCVAACRIRERVSVHVTMSACKWCVISSAFAEEI